MKYLFILLPLLGFSYAANSADTCECVSVTKFCVTRTNGTQIDVFVSLYDSKGNQVASPVELAHGVSKEEAIQILNSRACGN